MAGSQALVVFKTHLDIGFTDFAQSVVQRYREQYVPKALRLARELREADGEARFVWTTGSWLIHHILDVGSASERHALEDGIEAGDITWHALPFTTYTELLDGDLVRSGLNLSAVLDRRFGRQTKAAKMTDVPGHSKNLVPILADAGVTMFHLGINPVSAAVQVPPVFRWQVDDRELVCCYDHEYGMVSQMGDGSDLIFAHTGDNLGPPSVADVQQLFIDLGEKYPNGVRAGTLDMAAATWTDAARSELPTVTGEMADTWIHGVGSDPQKVSEFRALQRLRRELLDNGLTQPDELRGFDESLLLVAEHTWGLDLKVHLADYRHYTRSDFTKARSLDSVTANGRPDDLARYSVFIEEDGGHGLPSFSRMERSWAEQRAYLDQAVAALPKALQPAAQAARQATQAHRHPFTSLRSSTFSAQVGEWSLSIDENAALISCVKGDRELVSAQPWAALHYQRYGAQDYDAFHAAYNRNFDDPDAAIWGLPDFSKVGLNRFGLPAAIWKPRVVNTGYLRSRWIVEATFPEEAVEEAGAPALVQCAYEMSEHGLLCDLTWFDKPANRLPEALWWSFGAGLYDTWRVDKLGRWIDPQDIIAGGNHCLHAVGTAIEGFGTNERIRFEPLDSPLVSIGERRLFPGPNTYADPRGGAHFCLLNNVWNTNHPQWISGNGRSRILIKD